MTDSDDLKPPDSRHPTGPKMPNQARMGVGVALVLALISLVYGWWHIDRQNPPQAEPPVASDGDRGEKPDGSASTRVTLIPKVRLKNQSGDTIYEGPIDLQPTLDRIAKGVRNQHRNDGTVFRNREGQLPRQKAGNYYHEYVVPTPNEPGPGPQRLVLGQDGEVYYTADHYRSFRKIDVKFDGQIRPGSG